MTDQRRPAPDRGSEGSSPGYRGSLPPRNDSRAERVSGRIGFARRLGVCERFRTGQPICDSQPDGGALRVFQGPFGGLPTDR